MKSRMHLSAMSERSALAQNVRPANSNDCWEWVAADAFVRQFVVAVAQGTQAIVHAVNLHGYLHVMSEKFP